MNIAYQAIENVQNYYVFIDSTVWKLRTRRTIKNFGDQQSDTKDKPLEKIEVLPVYLDPFSDYNYAQIEQNDIPQNLIPISWHELPLVVKQQIVQLEENEKIGVYHPQRPSILFTG